MQNFLFIYVCELANKNYEKKSNPANFYVGLGRLAEVVAGQCVTGRCRVVGAFGCRSCFRHIRVPLCGAPSGGGNGRGFVEIAAVCFHCPQFRAEVDESAAEDAVSSGCRRPDAAGCPGGWAKDYAGVAARAPVLRRQPSGRLPVFGEIIGSVVIVSAGCDGGYGMLGEKFRWMPVDAVFPDVKALFVDFGYKRIAGRRIRCVLSVPRGFPSRAVQVATRKLQSVKLRNAL